ncbi:hypothetical protein BGZ54_006064 [Gamsiella multidivaricata]|nr:hypothetical protein BGZ54_006064 [Gamsiella multidivaricata]
MSVVDLAFNDAYMRHIYKSMTKPSWTSPLQSISAYSAPSDDNGSEDPSTKHVPTGLTHISILGDLFSSQWIDDDEFQVRLGRYRSIFIDPALMKGSGSRTSNHVEYIPELINVTGNHDIGYGYDISQSRLDRWEEAFGKSNFVSSVFIPSTKGSPRDPPSTATSSARKLHFVVLNTMLLDGPSSDENLRSQTWQFMQEAAEIKTLRPNDKIVLLTHIPFHKEAGICVDAPDIRLHWDNTIIEQTMLTLNTTQWILDHLKPDLILNGHDHFGCDVTHTKDIHDDLQQQQQQQQHALSSWTAYATSSLSVKSSVKNRISVREITQRSMMAEYGGYSGLFEVRVIPQAAAAAVALEDHIPDLEFHYTACGFFTDMQVWIVIIIDLIVACIWILLALFIILKNICGRTFHPKHTYPIDKKQKLM